MVYDLRGTTRRKTKGEGSLSPHPPAHFFPKQGNTVVALLFKAPLVPCCGVNRALFGSVTAALPST